MSITSNNNNLSFLHKNQTALISSTTAENNFLTHSAGILDSGTQNILLSSDSATFNNYHVYNSLNPIEILFGNNLTFLSDTECLINNSYPAHIVDNLSSNLIGIGSLVDNNNSVTFTPTDVIITPLFSSTNNNNHSTTTNSRDAKQKQLVLKRCSDGLWRAPFDKITPFLIKSEPTFTDDDTHVLLNYNFMPKSATATHHNIVNSNSARIDSLSTSQLSITNKVLRLHQRMGHASSEALCLAISGPTPIWIHTEVTSADIRRVFNNYSCISCILCKRNHETPQTNITTTKNNNHTHGTSNNNSHTLSYKINTTHSNYLPGECITADVLPRLNPTSIHGDNYIFVFEDIATGYLWTIPSKNDDSSAFLEALLMVYNFINAHNRKLSILRTDGGSNLTSKQVHNWLSDHHITAQFSAPYKQFQNEVERHVQTMIINNSTIF